MLIEAMMKKNGPEELAQLFDYLGTYVYEHFSAEEALMRVNAYPQLARAPGPDHQGFIEDLQRQQLGHERPPCKRRSGLRR